LSTNQHIPSTFPLLYILTWQDHYFYVIA
jgi:hypothetical protein